MSAECRHSFLLFLLPALDQRRRDQGCQRDGQDHTDTGRKPADGLHGDEDRAEQMVESQAPDIEENDECELAAEEGQDQGIGHRSDHIAADVHAGFEEFFLRQGRIGRMNLLQCRGNAHRHVHDSTEGTDDDACHQKALQMERNVLTGVFQLEQGLRVFQTKAVNLGKVLHGQAEDHGQECPGYGAEESADGLPVNAAQDRKCHDGNIRAHDESREYGRCAFDEQRDQDEEQADDREAQSEQGFHTGPAADQCRYGEEDQKEDGEHRDPVEFVDRGAVGAINMGLDGQGDAVSHFDRDAVQRSEIVVDGHRLAFIAAAFDDGGKLLRADVGVVRHFIGPLVFTHDREDFRFFELDDLVFAVRIEDILLTVQNVVGIEPEEHGEKDHRGDRQYDDAEFMLLHVCFEGSLLRRLL